MSKRDSNKISSYEKLLKKKEHIYKKGAKPIIGIDIGSNYIKIVKMKSGNKIAQLGIEQLPEGVVTQGRIEAQDFLIDIIKNILKENRITGKDCAVCISGNEIVVRELTIPDMDENQIENNIRDEMVSFIPLKYEDYSVDYKIIEYIKGKDNASGKLKLLVAAVPRRQARTYVDTLKKAGLRVRYIDIVPNIASKLARGVMYASAREENRDIAIIDFGAQTTNITVTHQGDYSLHKTIETGGDYLTATIAEKAGMNENQAEEYKCNSNFFANNSDPLSQHVQNYFEFHLKDIQRILEFFKNRNNNKGISQIYIMGGGSALRGLPGYLEKQLGVNVFLLSEALELFRGSRNQTKYLGVLFNAIGATMREDG